MELHYLIELYYYKIPLLLRLAKRNINLKYLKGKDNVIADTLIRVSPPESEPEDNDNFDVIPVHHITLENPATGSQLKL